MQESNVGRGIAEQELLPRERKVRETQHHTDAPGRTAVTDERLGQLPLRRVVVEAELLAGSDRAPGDDHATSNVDRHVRVAAMIEVLPRRNTLRNGVEMRVRADLDRVASRMLHAPAFERKYRFAGGEGAYGAESRKALVMCDLYWR